MIYIYIHKETWRSIVIANYFPLYKLDWIAYRSILLRKSRAMKAIIYALLLSS